MELIHFKDVNMDYPVVYGIIDSRNYRVMYVGQTIKPKKRIENYKYPNLCHNGKLKKWLNKNMEFARFTILESNPKDIQASEIKWINSFKGLFNIIYGECEWINDQKPWMAGCGISCPSSYFIKTLSSRKSHLDIVEKVKKLREKMTDLERVNYEISLAYEYRNYFYKTRINQWLDVVQDKLIAFLEFPENRNLSDG